MKWFNPSAIVKEISKIRWPEKKDLAENTVQVIIFTAAFCVFFMFCFVLISLILKGIGAM